MAISDSAAGEQSQLLGSGTAAELIPELMREGLQALNTAALGTNLHQRTAQRRSDTRVQVLLAIENRPAAGLSIGLPVHPPQILVHRLS